MTLKPLLRKSATLWATTIVLLLCESTQGSLYSAHPGTGRSGDDEYFPFEEFAEFEQPGELGGFQNAFVGHSEFQRPSKGAYLSQAEEYAERVLPLGNDIPFHGSVIRRLTTGIFTVYVDWVQSTCDSFMCAFLYLRIQLNDEDLIDLTCLGSWFIDADGAIVLAADDGHANCAESVQELTSDGIQLPQFLAISQPCEGRSAAPTDVRLVVFPLIACSIGLMSE